MHTRITSETQEVIIGPDRPLVIIGERINPTGHKKLAEALERRDMSYVQEEALRQIRAGANILDVNVGISGVDEAAVMVEAIQAIREVVDVPLCIDSANPKVLAAGLKVCKGKVLVNSVNGEKAKLEEVLPLIAEYRAAVVALTMDDKGIPMDVPTRVAIAEKILAEADRRGIPAEDVIVDPLAMSVASDDKAGLGALTALAEIRDRLGVNQTIGASNVSFGLPERRAINCVFLAMAVNNGLTCPITDPTVWEIRRTLLLADLFQGKDEYAMNFFSAYRERFPEAD